MRVGVRQRFLCTSVPFARAPDDVVVALEHLAPETPASAATGLRVDESEGGQPVLLTHREIFVPVPSAVDTARARFPD
jgi:hypothetical protein